MVRKIENIYLITFIVLQLVLVKSSSSTLIPNELLEELKAELKSLRVKVDLLEARNIDNVNLLTTKILKQEEEIAKLKAKIDAKHEAGQPSGPFDDERDLHPNDDNKTISNINKKEGLSGHSSTRALAPSSCRELSLIGHSLDGLYLVQNQDTKKIETVLCSFETSVVQDLIGTVDVKTKNIHFYVQRNSSFGPGGGVIPFELAPVNEGNAFDLTLGTFTVPVPGIYHFDFSAVKSSSTTYLDVYLQVNGFNIGLASTDQSATGSFDVISLSASLKLEIGDKVNMFHFFGMLFDSDDHYTHFSGWLVEENLM